MRTISAETARRLAITRQQLDATRRAPTRANMFKVARELGCLQLDPISVVARSHTLVMFSRVGKYERADLDRLIYRDKKLFEYWAHAASLVLTEDYPIHARLMRTYGKGDNPWYQRVATWVDENRALRDSILRQIKRDGPVSSRVLTEAGEAPRSWVSSGWTNDRNVSRMIDFLWTQGKIMVAGREGLNKFWDLTERVLPDWTPREVWDEKRIVTQAAQYSLRGLGVGSTKQIAAHYIQGRYPDLQARLNELEAQGLIEQVQVQEWKNANKSEPTYVHAKDLPLLKRIERGDWEGRTVLLSPFDNLVRDRVRNIQFWNFDYKIEIYVPQAKRKYGYYVLPILHQDKLIGRIDPQMERAKGILHVRAVHAEPNAPKDARTAKAVRGAIEELGDWLGAKEIRYGNVPEMWAKSIRA